MKFNQRKFSFENMFSSVKHISIILCAGLILTSCGGLQKVALSTTASIVYKSSPGMEEENNLKNFEASTLGNLKLVETLWSSDRDNEDLLTILIKGHAAYGFAVHETRYLGDFLSENDKENNKREALLNYSKSMKYGIHFLKENGVSYDDLVREVKEDSGIPGLLSLKLDDDHRTLEAVMFTAQALGSLINLQRTDMTLVGQMPIVKGMFDWVCGIKPDMALGTCDLFYGSYEAGRPKMLGGNPEKGRKYFEDGIKKYPNNWLLRVGFLQFYAIPMSDEDIYNEQKKFLNEAAKLHEKELFWKPFTEKNKAFDEKNLRIYQTIAIERFNIIKKYEEDLF